MRAYLVALDLKSKRPKVQAIYEAIKGRSSWWHYLDSVWIVVGDRDEDDLFEDVRPHLSKKDMILITAIGSVDDMQGYLPEDAWEWLHENV